MKTKTRFALCITALGLLLAGYGALLPSRAAGAEPARAQITILYDAFGKPSAMEKDWGFAALIEYGGKRILFDTGDNPDILANNAKAKGVDLSKLDFVVLSHRHGDHMGGMEYLLSVNPEVRIYAPKENFGVYGFSLPGSVLPQGRIAAAGAALLRRCASSVMKFGSAWPRANFELIEKTTEIAPGIHLIALVSDKPATLETARVVACHRDARRHRTGGRLLTSGNRQDRGSRRLDQPAHPPRRRRISSGRGQGRRDREESFRAYTTSAAWSTWRPATARVSPRSWRSSERLASVICTPDSAPRSGWAPHRAHSADQISAQQWRWMRTTWEATACSRAARQGSRS